jgi:hypothetical protein
MLVVPPSNRLFNKKCYEEDISRSEPQVPLPLRGVVLLPLSATTYFELAYLMRLPLAHCLEYHWC